MRAPADGPGDPMSQHAKCTRMLGEPTERVECKVRRTSSPRAALHSRLGQTTALRLSGTLGHWDRATVTYVRGLHPWACISTLARIRGMRTSTIIHDSDASPLQRPRSPAMSTCRLEPGPRPLRAVSNAGVPARIIIALFRRNGCR